MTVTHSSAAGNVRPAACAGRFFPANPAELVATVQGLLAAAPIADGSAPEAVIVPHAGYVYSGMVAASAYARLAQARDVTRRVVLVGPSHYANLSGLAVSSADAFATPLGVVPLDKEAIARIRSLPQV